jgi:hypothetical protein
MRHFPSWAIERALPDCFHSRDVSEVAYWQVFLHSTSILVREDFSHHPAISEKLDL